MNKDISFSVSYRLYKNNSRLGKIDDKCIWNVSNRIINAIKDKIETLENIINFYLHEANFNNQTVQ